MKGFLISLAFTVLAAVAVAIAVDYFVIGDIVATGRSHVKRVAPYAISIRGNAMETMVDQEIDALNARRAANVKGRASKILILENVSYQRSGGKVVSAGRIMDLEGPRSIVLVLDMFDVGGRYLSSASVTLSSRKGVSTDFGFSIVDRPDGASFSIRALDQGMSEIRMQPANELANIGVRRLLPDDMLYPGDLQELTERLTALGYGYGKVMTAGDVPMLAVMRRFRADHGISGPDFVSIGDLVAIRLVTRGVRPVNTAQLERY